jgi:hypothetical protein
MAKNNTQTIFEFIRSREVQAILTALGVIVLMANLWLVSKLSPLTASIDALTARADHTDNKIVEFIPRRELELTIDPLKEDIGEIKSDVKEIKAILSGYAR